MSLDEFSFSFHCIICFDAFNLDDRPPVILPCGHTYVCMSCAKRLRRCMECRTSLYYTPPHNVNQKQPRHYRPSLPLSPSGISSTRGAAAARYGAPRRHNAGGTNPPQQEHKPEPVPLPLPKNLLMMSLIEAAQRQSKAERKGNSAREGEKQNQSTPSYSTHEENSSPDCDDGNDEEKIKAAFGALSSPYGTYAITEKAGLTVLPHHPDDKENKNYGDQETPEHEQGPVHTHPLEVNCGQLLQVVDFKDNVAKLARGRGYVVASSTQLVKVGVPQDKVCEIEGMLLSVSKREREVQAQMEKIKQIRCGLELQHEHALMVEDAHPVITSAPLEAKSSQEDNAGMKHSEDVITTPQKQAGSPTGCEPEQCLASSPLFSPASVPNETQSPIGQSSIGQSSPHTVDNSELYKPNRIQQAKNDEYDEPLALMGCSNIFGVGNDQNSNSILISFDSAIDSGCGQADRPDEHTVSAATRSVEVAFVPNQPDQRDPPSKEQHAARRHSLNGHHATNTPLTSGSFDYIDFRTGMSGHRALTNSKSHADQHTLQSTRSPVRMMSQHGGVCYNRSIRRNRLLQSTTNGAGDIRLPTLNTISRWMKSNPSCASSHAYS